MNQAMMFQFEERKSAYAALDTLVELGYRAQLAGSDERPELHVRIDQNDLTSALEIMQAFGGRFMEEPSVQTGDETYRQAYDLDAVLIPAHAVADEEAGGVDDAGGACCEAGADFASHPEDEVDPSAETYDHFSADIRM